MGVTVEITQGERTLAYFTETAEGVILNVRAQGLPEELVGKATEKMSRINEAWNRIRERRGI